MKKKVILVAALSATALCAAIAVSGKVNLSSMHASVDETWSHYTAVEPDGFGERGIKEYWVNCSTHESQFTKPDVSDSLIEEKGAPSQAFIESLDEEDARLIKPRIKYIDFEDEGRVYPFYDASKCTNFSNFSIQDGVGYNGSKCLVAETNNNGTDRGLWFTKQYLDLVFSDASIKAIEFDAKGDTASSNFRHRNSSGSNVCYQLNSNGWGITTSWQTFSFTRAMYEDIAATGGFVIYGQSYGNLYLDNIRPVTWDMVNDNTVTSKYVTMDALGQITGVGTSTDVLIKNAFQNTVELKIWSNAATNLTAVDYSTTIKSQGSRSLHIHKVAGSQLCLGLIDRVVNAVDDNGIKFDIYTTVTVGAANFLKFVNRTSSTTSGTQISANKWTTVTVAKENIRDCGDGKQDYLFNMLGSDGTKEMDLYIDNIRPATSTDTVIDFEDNGMYTFDTSYREFTCNFTGHTGACPLNSSNLRDSGNAIFWLNNPNGAGTVSIDSERSSEGARSLRFDIVDGSKSFYLFFNKSINTSLSVGDAISFDVYNKCSGNITLGQAPTAGRSTGTVCAKDQWTTVTLTKGTEKADQFFRLHEAGAGSTGTFWIDNIRVVRAS